MPVYDRVKLLEQSIESVIGQDFQDYELLIVLDGSPKATRDKVITYRKHPKIRVVELQVERNTGNACIGRNVGIIASKGENIAFLDSDDVCLPERLGVSEEILKLYDVVCGDFIITGTKKGHFKGLQPILEDQVRMNCIGIPTVAARKEKLLLAGGFKKKMRYMEDAELWSRMLYLKMTFRHIDKDFAIYIYHNGGLEYQMGQKEGVENLNKKWLTELQKEYMIIPKKIDLVKFKEL